MRTQMLLSQCRAEILRLFRNKYYIFWSLMMPIMFYFLFTRVISTGVDDAKLWQGHYLMSMTTFSVMGSAIMTLGIRLVQERTQGWSTYISVTPLPASIYFMSKMIGQTIVHLFSIIFIFIAGYLINGVTLSAFQWLACAGWILIASLPFLALGTLIGAMKKVDTASGVSNVVYMLLAISGGMWMPINVLPDFLQKIGKWMPSFSFGNGAWGIVHGEAFAWKNVFILLGYFILFMILSVYVRKKQRVV